MVNKAIQRLEIQHLQKATKQALLMDEICLTVHAGEIFALIGGHLSCKTLLSKTIIKLVKKTKGEVFINGESQKKLKKNASRIGVCLAQQNFYLNTTAYKTLEQCAMLHNCTLSHSTIANTLNLVDLKKIMHNTLSTFSASEIARLKIAVAILLSPEILILDNPFKDLSDTEARKIRIIIKTIAEIKNTAVFVTSANAEAVEEFCDTIGIIDDGFIVSIKSYNQYIKDDAPYEKIRVYTQTPNYAAKVIEETLKFQTHLCGEWVIVDTLPENAQAVASVLTSHDIKILSVQRVNRSLQEQFYEIISARRANRVGGAS